MYIVQWVTHLQDLFATFKEVLCQMNQKTLEEVVNEEEWTKTPGADPKNFLVHDSSVGKRQRVIVFATAETLRHLALADIWVC